MSTFSIIHNTDDKIAIQVNEFLVKSGTKNLLKKRFDVGEGVCIEDIRKINRLVKIFCQSSCQLDCEDFIKVKEEINSILIYNIPEL